MRRASSLYAYLPLVGGIIVLASMTSAVDAQPYRKIAVVVGASGCASWEGGQICRVQPANGGKDYDYFELTPMPKEPCSKPIERFTAKHSIDDSSIYVEAKGSSPTGCLFNQVPERVFRLLMKKS